MNNPSPPATVPSEADLARGQGEPSRKRAKSDEFDLWLEAGRSEKHYWLDLWRYRELFLILAWRDVMVRYKQTVVGITWSLLQPFLTMMIMTIIFGRLAGLHSDGGVPYSLMVLSGMLPWQFFANALSTSGQSLVNNANLVSKIYFPRLIIPASTVVVALVDFLFSILILAAMMVFYRFVPSWRVIFLPILVCLAFLASLGPALCVTTLNVRYRDFRFVMPFVIQFGLYLCPVGFSSSVIREKLGDTALLFYSLNPMVGLIDGFRWAILGDASSLYLPAFLISCSVIVAFLIGGIWYFRKMERSFADNI
jgi:lipopolysaccharide transport system permease protein